MLNCTTTDFRLIGMGSRVISCISLPIFRERSHLVGLVFRTLPAAKVERVSIRANGLTLLQLDTSTDPETGQTRTAAATAEVLAIYAGWLPWHGIEWRLMLAANERAAGLQSGGIALGSGNRLQYLELRLEVDATDAAGRQWHSVDLLFDDLIPNQCVR